jgi:hypothetical protein
MILCELWYETCLFFTFSDNFKTENEVEMHDDSYVSSFMVKRSEEPNQRQSCLLNELNHRKSYLVNEPNHRKSAPTEEEIQAEPIYCKIQPKVLRLTLAYKHLLIFSLSLHKNDSPHVFVLLVLFGGCWEGAGILFEYTLKLLLV